MRQGLKVKEEIDLDESLWNYIKTGIPLITGSIPVSAMETIKTALNNGITFWHDSDLGNYNRNNEVTGLEGW